mgnify:CR=1 FL=1
MGAGVIARPGAPNPKDVVSGACDLSAVCGTAKSAGGAAKAAAGDAAGDAASGAADSFMEKLIEGTLNGLVEIIGNVAMSMFAVPEANVGEAGGGSVTPSTTLTAAYEGLNWIIIVVMILSMLWALGRIMWTLEAAESKIIVRMMINVVSSTTILLGAVILGLEFSEKASPWFLTKISGYREDELNSGEKLTEALMGLNMTGSTAGDASLFADLALVGLILLVIVFCGVLAMIVFLIVRNPLIVAMCAFLPIFAASTATRSGQERFNKALAYLLAFVLYKPVAGIIMGIGLRMLKPLDADEQPLMTFISGAVLVALTGFALPAMVKLFVSDAAIGSSNAFSGGAVVAAGGAAVMSSAMLAGSFASGGASGAGAAGSAGAGTSPPPPTPGGPGGGGGQQSLPPGGGGGQPALPPGSGGGSNGGGGSGPPGASGGSESGSQMVGGSGASGDSGPPGSGSAGEDGSSGASGGSGSGGDSGIAGGSGASGADGSSGTGESGASGAAGSSGADGQGRDGADGATGQQGQEGQQGQQGLTGAASSSGGGSSSGGASGASAGGGHLRTAEGAQVVGSRALGKAAMAAGTGGQQAAKGATGAANEMSQGA